MKRAPFFGAAAILAAGALAAIPAVLGLADNSSFSRQLPVRAPVHAQVVELHSTPTPLPTAQRASASTSAPVLPTELASSTRRGREVEQGDDRGVRPAPGDDRRDDRAGDDGVAHRQHTDEPRSEAERHGRDDVPHGGPSDRRADDGRRGRQAEPSEHS